jgi:ubiquinone/menaquinone biosynthesis C-methylase UbiE
LTRYKAYEGTKADEYYKHRLSYNSWLIKSRTEKDIVTNNISGIVVDVGCGNGRNSSFIKNSIGIDRSERMLQLAKKEGLNNTMRADVHSLPIRNESVDTVICIRVMYLLDN